MALRFVLLSLIGGCIRDRSSFKVAPGTDKYSNSGYHMRFLRLMTSYESFITDIFSSAPQDVRTVVEDVLTTLKEPLHSSMYSLACLLNAALFFGQIVPWKNKFGIYLVKRATDSARKPHEVFDD